MLFAWMGFIKPGEDEVPQDVQQQTSDFLQQPFMPVQSAGPLCDENGRKAAMLMIFEADDRAAADALVQSSPYRKAGLYDRHYLFEFHDEVG